MGGMNANKESTYLGPSIIQLCVCDIVDLTWRGHADGRVDDAMNSRKTHEERNGERTKGESEGYNFKDQGEMTHDGEIQCVSSESMHVYRSSHLGSTRHVDIYLVAGLNSAAVKNQDSTTWKASLFGA